MNTDLGYLAVDSQVAALGDCDGRCNENQGRGECTCLRRHDPSPRLVLLCVLLPLAMVGAWCVVALWSAAA